ncbi:hypothetical protein D3C86_2164670 [compost metagenome]
MRSIAIPALNARGAVIAAINVGVAATQADIADLTGFYLPALRQVQGELRAVLR